MSATAGESSRLSAIAASQQATTRKRPRTPRRDKSPRRVGDRGRSEKPREIVAGSRRSDRQHLQRRGRRVEWRSRSAVARHKRHRPSPLGKLGNEERYIDRKRCSLTAVLGLVSSMDGHRATHTLGAVEVVTALGAAVDVASELLRCRLDAVAALALLASALAVAHSGVEEIIEVRRRNALVVARLDVLLSFHVRDEILRRRQPGRTARCAPDTKRDGPSRPGRRNWRRRTCAARSALTAMAAPRTLAPCVPAREDDMSV